MNSSLWKHADDDMRLRDVCHDYFLYKLSSTEYDRHGGEFSAFWAQRIWPVRDVFEAAWRLGGAYQVEVLLRDMLASPE